MEWGAHLPHLGRSAGREAVVDFAREAERAGVDSLWASDHIAWPAEVRSKYPYTADGSFPGGFDMPWLEPLATLCFVAGCTERARLGTTVLILGYRPPVLTAKLVSTLDVLSGGRLVLGVGVGWMREEFEVLQMPFDERGARADEQLALFDTLFADPTPSFEGRFYRFPPIGFSPKPVQAHVPIWVGGSSEPAFRRAARVGDGFHVAFQPAAEVARSGARVRALAEEHGRDPEALVLSVRWYLDPEGRMDPAVSFQGDAGAMAERARELAHTGVGHVVLDPVAPGGVPGRLDALRRFMDEVAPALAG